MSERNGGERLPARGAVTAALIGLCLLCDHGHCTPAEFDWGPFCSSDVTVDGCRRFRALGPLFEKQSSPDGLRFKALRPLWSRIEHPERDRGLVEILWPIGMFKDLGTDRFWRFLPFYGNDFDTTDPGSRKRFALFPLLWAGRDAGGDGYLGLLPIGGSIREILGQDRVDFALLPLYLRSTANDKQSTSIMWPFFSRTSGGGWSGWRVFPLYGVMRHEDRFERRFVMWPFGSSVKYLNTEKKGKGGAILFPLYGYDDAPQSKTTWILPPFFRFTRGEGLRRVYCPYPLVQYETGEVERLYIWPLWGRRKRGTREEGFLLYPIGWHEKVTRRDETLSRLKIVPLLHTARRMAARDDADGNRVEGEVERYFKLWPLCSYRRDGDVSRLRLPDLWPAEDSRSVEKNYAPFWTMYSRTVVGQARDSELMWGLYRHRKDAHGRRLSLFPLFSAQTGNSDEGGWSLLRGLVGYERKAERRAVKLLYVLRIGGRESHDE